MSRRADASDTILVTGFPSYVARRVCVELLTTRNAATVYLLYAQGDVAALDAFLGALPPEQRERVSVLQGDVSHMDIGLTSEDYRRLVDELTEVQHLAARFQGQTAGSPSSVTLKRTNVNGTREVLELAGQCEKLRCFAHWSTVRVSGNRIGVVLEEELECGQRFRGPYEQTRYEAERLVRRAARKLPVTVLRTGIVVGDSDTGVLEPYEGPYRLVSDFVVANREQPMILPGPGHAPVHLVPVDFVVRAGCYLATDESAKGKTFHLVDPSPLPARTVYQLIARKAHRKPIPQAVPNILSKLMRLSSRVERLAPFPVAAASIFDHMVFYNCQNTLTHLAGTALHCPPFSAYVERLVRYINEENAARSAAMEEHLADPLA